MKLEKLLLDWYDANARELPWRGTKDPYRIWLSEIMLQQTRTEAVRKYYARFLARFPDVHALAAASEDEVLKLWEGLGYYSRARNLHAAAKAVSQAGGVFPDTLAGLQALPGIGPYAARAIGSIAYNICAPALDGNQMRVLSRCFAAERILKTPFDLEAEAMACISPTRPGDYNQALMDLGSAICTPKKPKCGGCPLSPACRAFREGEPERYPLRPAPVPKRELDLSILLVETPDGICIRRRPAKGLLGGLWEFPTLDGHMDESELRSSLAELGFSAVGEIRPLPAAKHVFTHLIWRMQGWHIRAEKAPGDLAIANSETLDTLAFPSAIRVYREIAVEILR
ncbi:MAG: A/G-specific adenine glycosylase [Clostridia bacterium]|nr:A/G-specific adenine glycosylase [Clostridia bacterium]